METSSLLQNVAVLAIEITASVLLVLLGLLARKGVNWVAAKADYEVSSNQMLLVDNAVAKAINFAEEWAHKQASDLGDIKGSDKLEVAGNFLLDMAEAQGLDEWVMDKAQELIESKLGEWRDN